MNQRFTLDRRSFEHFLAALCLVQQLKSQATYLPANDGNQPFLSLLQLQRAINSETVDLPSIMASVIKLTKSVTGANAAGVWLFRNEDEFACCAHIGSIQDPDRLGADILAQLAKTNYPDANSCAFSPTLQKASHYPGSPNSAAIAALREKGKVLGAVAAFSGDFEAFASRDLDNLHFLAGLLEQALAKAVRAGYRDAVALEHAALLQLLEETVPQVKALGRQSPSRIVPALGSSQDYSETTERAVFCRLQQASAIPTPPSEPAGTSSSNYDRTAADISVPGIGVRAALGDVREFTGEERPSLLGQAVRTGSAGVRGLGVHCRSGALRIATSFSRTRDLTAHAGQWSRRIAQRASLVPSAQLSSITTSLHDRFTRIRHWRLKARLIGVGRLRLANWLRLNSSRSASEYFRWPVPLRSLIAKSRTLLDGRKRQFAYLLRLAKVELRSLKREFRQKRANLSAVVAEERMRARIAHRRQKSMLANSAELTGEALQQAGESLAEVASSAGQSTITAFSTLKDHVIAMERPRFNPWALRRSAGAIGVLSIMAIFLASQASVRHSLGRVNAASASLHTVVPSEPAALAESSVKFEPGPSSHLEITDASVADTLHDLTRYEIITLQRAAGYGDDEASFALGMAYETGYYVQQNCAKAAHWVKVAAESGNPAAAYNLGLRYRNGDGLAADESAAEHWLRMASSRKYSPAKLAMAAVR